MVLKFVKISFLPSYEGCGQGSAGRTVMVPSVAALESAELLVFVSVPRPWATLSSQGLSLTRFIFIEQALSVQSGPRNQAIKSILGTT